MMMKIQFPILPTTTLAIILFAITFQNSHAQDPITPTPAPSKTPTATVINTPEATSEGQPANDPIPQIDLTEPFTQADLSILTGNIQRPNGLTWFNSKIYVSCSGDWTLYEIDTHTGTTTQYIYGVKNAHAVFAESIEQELGLWIPDFQSNTLNHIRSGVSSIVVSNLDGPWGIAPLNDEFIITNLRSDTAIIASRDGETQELISNLRSPAGVATDAENIYIANSGSARRAIEWFSTASATDNEETLDAEANTETHSLVTGIQNVTSLALGADQYLYFSYSLGTRGIVGRVEPKACINNSGCNSEDVEIVVYTELAAPLAGLALTPDMRLFIHTIFSPDIYWIDLANTTETE